MLVSGILAPGPLFISNVGCADYLNSQFLLSNSDSFFFLLLLSSHVLQKVSQLPGRRTGGRMGRWEALIIFVKGDDTMLIRILK